MIVEKEDTKKAKEKLGDKNAFLIAEIQDLKEFDERNLKALCPHHSEDTPSYIYDKKRHRFKCFGCGYTADIIDAQMEKGKTFLESCKFLFDEADMKYQFGEMNVKTKSNYRYPKEEHMGPREKVFEYLGQRKISKNVIDYLDIREDARGNAVFNFYDPNDCLTMVKYRPARTVNKQAGETKTWSQPGADTTPLLFNMNRINNSKPLLICEGEIDCASAIEAGYLNSVSVPFGAGNFGWIEENWEWLQQFDDIIVWSDNDDAGEKMRKECIYRLGSWRTRYIETPKRLITEDGRAFALNDINDCLQIGGKEYVMNLIMEAKDVPVKSVIDYSMIEELNISEMDGVTTGIKPLDDELLKLFYGTLTILSGRPGSGKTSIIDQMVARTMDEGKSVFLFSKELPERMSASWFNTIIAGRRNLHEFHTAAGKTFKAIPKDKQKLMQEYYKDQLKIYRDSEPNDVDSVMHSAEECVRKYGCKLVVLDNLMMIDLHCNETEKNTAQTDLINRLINFASKFNVAVVLVAHPRKTQFSNTDIEMYDIAGSSNIINLAMRSIGLRRVTKREKEDPKSPWQNYDVVLTVIKDRMLGKVDLQIGLWFDIESRRFYTSYDEYDYKFKWDTRNYFDKLPYEDRSKVDVIPV